MQTGYEWSCIELCRQCSSMLGPLPGAAEGMQVVVLVRSLQRFTSDFEAKLSTQSQHLSVAVCNLSQPAGSTPANEHRSGR